MKHLKRVLLSSVVVFGSGGLAAHADTINFSQFGASCTTHSSPLTGVTEGGVSVTLTSPNGYFEQFTETPTTAGCPWNGNFYADQPVLFDGTGAGAVNLAFATPITSLTLAVQANLFGFFTETITAYDAAHNVLDTASATDTNPGVSTIPFLTVTGADIVDVVAATTNDGEGLALYGGAGGTHAPGTPVPEPASASLLLSALGAFEVWRRRRRHGCDLPGPR